MIVTVLFSVALVLLIIAAYTDIRTREVPDFLNYSGIAAGIGIRLVWGTTTGDWSALGWGLLGFGVFFAFACLMFYTGQWGGGDSKLLMAVGAILGFRFDAMHPAIAFILWSLLAGAVYGLLWSVWLAVKNWGAFVRQYRVVLERMHAVRWLMLGVFAFGLAFAIAAENEWARIASLSAAIAAPVLYATVLGVKTVEQCCMIRPIPPAKLTEGDWIAKEVRYKGKYVCGPKDLGVTKEKILELRRLNIKNVLVKEGIPFVPSFLAGFLLMLWLGSPLHYFF
jgi:Flp pilus assembly protein protease CpaA